MQKDKIRMSMKGITLIALVVTVTNANNNNGFRVVFKYFA